MKYICLIAGLAVFVLTTSVPVMAQTNPRFGKTPDASLNKLVVGAQGHATISDFTDLPLKSGDYSYKLMYEYHEGIGYWQLGASYAPSPSAEGVEYVLTPQVNLILKDRIYRLGAGALKSYVEGDEDSHWTSVYWQICAGLGIPLGSRFSLDLYGHYVFERWDSIRDSDKGGVEYSALLAFTF